MGRKAGTVFIVAAILAALTGHCFAIDDLMIIGDHEYREIDSRGFRVGEHLTLKVSWRMGIKFFDVGYGELHVKEVMNVKGREVYHLVFNIRSAPFFDLFFKIRDVLESYMDRRGLFSWGFEMDINEGKKHYTRHTLFDQANGMGYHGSSFRRKVKEQPTLPNMQDFLSAIYYLRIFDKVNANEYPPLSYIEDQATKVILHKRKIKLLEEKKEEMYERELRRNNVKVFTQ